ncbi:TetR/AcrR family transcriptional regulator [Azospirillum sp. 412522]|nr:TetR/AcrR family transcriptional regulator [Azospirillum sp. 412522]MBY6262646.1 TetR/AcrR family transcriptional regulator [Azospirillum sp. 412522]
MAVARRARGDASGRETKSGPAAGGSATAILDASKALFLKHGYDGVNLEKIAAKAGVSRQTLYNQFGSKEAIFRAMLERHWAVLTGEALFNFAEGAAPTVDPELFLRSLAETIIRFIAVRQQVAFTKLVIAEARRLPWIAEEFYRIGKEPLLRGISGCLRRMTEAGSLNCTAPELAAHQFLGLIQELVFWPQVMAIGPGLEALPPADIVVEEAIRMFLSRYRA